MANLGAINLDSKIRRFKTGFLDSKWFILGYILFISLFILYQTFVIHNYANHNIEIILIAFLLVIGIFVLVYHSNHKDKLHRTAFIILVSFGIIGLVLSPILVHCDEDEHFARAELTSHGEFIPVHELQSSGKIGYASIQSFKDLDDKNRFKTILTTTIDDQKINYSEVTTGSAFAQNPFYGYLAQGFGIAIAKLFDLNNIWMLWLGGLFNLILYSSICSYAIKKTPMFKLPLLVVACLPFCLHQAFSMSSDATVNALAILIVAYFVYLYKLPDKSVDTKRIAKFLLLCLLLTLIKVPYLILAILILLVPRRKFKSKNTYYRAFIGLGILMVISVIWDFAYAVPALNASSRHTYFLEHHVDAKEQVKFLLANGNHIINLLVDSFSKYWFVIMDMFRYADWQGSPSYASSLLAKVFLVFFTFISFFYPIEKHIKMKKRVVMVGFVVLMYLAICVIEYLTWTKVGFPYVEGLQGRYFIPLLPLIPFILNINVLNTNIGQKISEKLSILRNVQLFDSWSIVMVIGLIASYLLVTLVKYY